MALTAVAEQQQLQEGTGAALFVAVNSGLWLLQGHLQHWLQHAAI